MHSRSPDRRAVVPAFPFVLAILVEKCRRREESRDDAAEILKNGSRMNGDVDDDGILSSVDCRSLRIQK